MTLDELINDLGEAREKAGKDGPVRIAVESAGQASHYEVTQVDDPEYDEGVTMVLVRGGPTVAATEGR